MHSSNLDTEFRKLVLAAIDETIHGVLGDRPCEVLFERLDSDFHLKYEEIPDRLEDFQTALDALLGAGSPILVRAIIHRLCGKLGIPFLRNNEWDFKTYVTDCMRRHKAR